MSDNKQIKRTPNFIFTDEHELLIMHYMMLVRQITDLTDSFMHLIRLHTRVADDPARYWELYGGYRAHAQTELADSICQIKRLCEILGISFSETEKLGDERYEKKKEEFLARYPTDKWI